MMVGLQKSQCYGTIVILLPTYLFPIHWWNRQQLSIVLIMRAVVLFSFFIGVFESWFNLGVGFRHTVRTKTIVIAIFYWVTSQYNIESPVSSVVPEPWHMPHIQRSRTRGCWTDDRASRPKASPSVQWQLRRASLQGSPAWSWSAGSFCSIACWCRSHRPSRVGSHDIGHL